jgi:hypothetical protein
VPGAVLSAGSFAGSFASDGFVGVMMFSSIWW